MMELGTKKGLVGKVPSGLGDKVFDKFNTFLMILIIIATGYPFFYCIILSFNEGKDAILGGIYFFPRKFTFENYITVFEDGAVTKAFLITVIRTVIGTTASVLFNAVVAYGLVKKELKFRKFYISYGMITMFFSGGIIPLYIVIMKLGMLDNFLVYIIPSLSGFFNIIIFMAFFREISNSLIESAKIDGAHEYTIFWKIVLPVSAPVIAFMALSYGVGHWNSWYDGYIYMSNTKLETLPTFLVKMIYKAQAEEILLNSGKGGMTGNSSMNITSDSIKLATMVISVLPIMCVYPFLQKYFVKGIMLGAIKG